MLFKALPQKTFPVPNGLCNNLLYEKALEGRLISNLVVETFREKSTTMSLLLVISCQQSFFLHVITSEI